MCKMLNVVLDLVGKGHVVQVAHVVDEVGDVIHSTTVDIVISITETWLKDHIDNSIMYKGTTWLDEID